MKNIKKLEVKFDDIQKAMEDVLRDRFDYFFDAHTGEVISFSEEIMRELTSRLYESDYEEIKEDIEYIEFDEEPDLPDWMLDEVDLILEVLLNREERYIRIPERKKSAAYQSMTKFIGTVKDPTLREELSLALNGKGAFRKFKDVLINYPQERKRWHGHNAKTMKNEIREWLHSIGVTSIS
jgi:hypothetical protein